MRTLLDILVLWPMPAVWILLPGLILLRRRLGRVLVVAGGVLLLVGSTPFAGGVLLGVLERGAPAFDSGVDSATRFDAIVVPLAGAYEDPDGRWRPLAGSVIRTVRAQQLRDETGLPMIVVGGAPLPSQTVSEAEALQRLVPLASDTIVESSARDTFETARAVAEIVTKLESGNSPRRVIVVTSPAHMARTSASLRRFGIEAVAAPLDRYVDPRLSQSAWLDFVPSARGLGQVRRALREYTGLGWYLVTRRIRLQDL